MIYNAGNVAGVSTIDELRVGTSFAIVTPLGSLQHQDPAGGPNTSANAANVPALTMNQLTPIVNEAIAQWSAAGITPTQTQLLESAHFVIQNLTGQGALALTAGTTRDDRPDGRRLRLGRRSVARRSSGGGAHGPVDGGGARVGARAGLPDVSPQVAPERPDGHDVGDRRAAIAFGGRHRRAADRPVGCVVSARRLRLQA